MTMWGKFFRTREPLGARTVELSTPDGDHLTLVRLDATRDAPVLVLLHGLEGTVNSHYVNGVMRHARAGGWTAVLMCFRTCDGRMNRARRTYHSGETTDLDLVVRALIAERPGRPIGLAGVSLGGNVLLKWLGEQGAEAPAEVRGAVAISTPCNLSASADRIDEGFSRLYQWNFVRKLREKALRKLADFPDVASASRVALIRSIREFDDTFTAPLHGFRDAADYYSRSSSLQFLPRIRRPTLLLTALDDPFFPASMTAEVVRVGQLNPHLTVEVHERGGHVGFVGGSPWKPSYYVERRVRQFLDGTLPVQPAESLPLPAPMA